MAQLPSRPWQAQLQQSIDQWIADNGGYWDEMSLLARLTEEVGELARRYEKIYLVDFVWGT